jgi:hypothetical protein
MLRLRMPSSNNVETMFVQQRELQLLFVFELVIERSRMSSRPPRLDTRDYGIFDAVAFFEAHS